MFPDTNPGESDATYVGMALVASIAFFASLVLHELGHALQARREGMQIEGITLWLFGGVAKFRGMFPSAGAEFRIAVAGPLVTLVIGGALVLVAWLVELPAIVDGVVAWLGYVNVWLLAFNLLPALPLDGGRILRSGLWAWRRSFDTATRIAAWIGRLFAYAFIGGGVALLIWGERYGGIWLAFVGWFLLQAASAEDRYRTTREALSGLRVRDLMVREPETVDADATVADLMASTQPWRRYTTYPVTDGGHVVGLVQLERLAALPPEAWAGARIREHMLPRDEIPVVEADADLVDAAAELGESDVRRGLVVDGDGRDVGLLSMTDVVRALRLRAPLHRS